MDERQPDIEIYLKRPSMNAIGNWLKNHFDIIAKTPTESGSQLDLRFQQETLQCLVVERVAKGGYASVWFKTNNTPWRNDLECAEDAHALLEIETRCSTGGWQDAQEDQGRWYRLQLGEKSIVNWLT